MNVIFKNFDLPLKNALFLISLSPCLIGNLNPVSNTQHCITTMAAPSWNCLSPENGDLSLHSQYDGCYGQENGGNTQEERGLIFLLKQEDREIQDSYLQLFNKLDVAVKEMKQYVFQINK